jgi:hypothetical protein
MVFSEWSKWLLRKSFSWILSMALMGVLISWLMVEIA